MDFDIAVPEKKECDAVALGLNAVDHLIVVPRYPEFNSKIRLTHHTVAPGGECATAMVALSRLGLRTRYIGRVGSDAEGRFQIEWLKSQGVDVTGLIVVDGGATQTAFIIIDETTGERTVIWHRDPALGIAPDHVDLDAVTAGRVLLINGPDVDACIVAAGAARAKGIPVMIDIETVYPGTERLLPLIDLLISSSGFPEMVTGERDLRRALKLLAEMSGAKLTAATLGSEGALAYCQGEYIASPAFRIDSRDTTGAGDAFHGGFIYGLLAGYSVEDTLRFANAVAGLKCRDVGAQTGLPGIEEVRALLDQDV
ncbi:MAG TPA: PfkB family carbohydrate kinase [Blastocatellia bacterium]|nr:PfkB family carbohydrate kinase [Blastocatellia bacterium]